MANSALTMAISLKRAYEPASSRDGERILVDGIWPRGVSKEKLDIKEWLKEIAPSSELRKAFHAGEMTWGEFRKTYMSELKPYRDTLRKIAKESRERTVTLVFSAANTEHNNAVVLKQYLNMLRGK
ncbi:DUF488 domain-containing protein [Marinobacter fonticola]|uniref:DUF488 domain-containing protein n=1 Tax=Marinobacter fonticola TaxID=2603215 RepID=UPI001D0DB8A0|nr:DUF488 family protein [Marinobacter fonticola]